MDAKRTFDAWVAGCIAIVTLLAQWPAAPAWADGGTVRLVERQRDYQISVFTSPNPLRAGPIDISVLVQDAASGTPIMDCPTTLRLVPRDHPRAAIECAATSEAATNKLFQAAGIELPTAGWWDVAVACRTPRGLVEVRFELEAAAAAPRLPALWPWIGWPLAAIVAFGAHQALVRRKAGAALSVSAQLRQNRPPGSGRQTPRR